TITSSNLTTNRVLVSNSSGKVAVSAVTSTELGYLDGVTSAIQTQLNGKASLNGSSTQDFTVKDLIIHGTVNHWLADVITVADARLQLNRTQGAATVASGLDIYNGTSVVSSLLYDTSGIWRAGGQRIYTDAYKPLADNATNLGSYSASSYPRKAEDAVVTGAWKFDNDLRIGTGLETATERLHVAGNGLFKSTSQTVRGRVIVADAADRAVFIESPIFGDAYANIGISGTSSHIRIGTRDFPDAINVLNSDGRLNVNNALSVSGTSTLTGNVTAGGNISASGDLSARNLSAQNAITAYGDITSYYGDITAVNAIFSGNINIG